MAEAPGLITKIPSSSVNQICSGQVIVSLSSCVKELLENSLDSNPTSITIKLHNSGANLVEVIDDGCGIKKADRPLVCAKHATSKLTSFDDLYDDSIVNKFGFRGEALFSLANVSEEVTVTTKVDGESVAEKLFYGNNGSLKEDCTTQVARKRGTTVAIKNLFHALPVRRTDLLRRLKSQRSALFKMLQAYALVCVGIKFTVTDSAGGGGKKGGNSVQTVKLATGMSKSLNQLVSSVLGSKFHEGLADFSVDIGDLVRELGKKDGKNNLDSSEKFSITGLISKPPIGSAKTSSARDLQFYSVNGRPVDIPKFSRSISEVWRGFDNSGKKPACVLNLVLPNSMFDINLSPDKREVFLSEESSLIELLCAKLTEFWSTEDRTFVSNEVQEMSEKSIEKSRSSGGGYGSC